MRRSRSIGIKTTRLRRGLYMFHYKHLYVIVYNVDGKHWEAFLPTGSFAQSNTKGLTIILACHEIDKTPRDLELEKEQRDADWWKKYFKDSL